MHTALDLRTHSPQLESDLAGADVVMEGNDAPHTRVLERVL